MIQAVRLANALVGCHKGPLNSIPEGPGVAKKSVWLYLEGREHVKVQESERNQGPESLLPANADHVAVDALQVEHDESTDAEAETGQSRNQQYPHL